MKIPINEIIIIEVKTLWYFTVIRKWVNPFPLADTFHTSTRITVKRNHAGKERNCLAFAYVFLK